MERQEEYADFVDLPDTQALALLPNEEGPSDAETVLSEIQTILAQVVENETKLDFGYARLGKLLLEVQEKEYWRGQYGSFGAYITEIKEKYNRGRSQLYNYIATVKLLNGFLDEKLMSEIGIAKARALAEGVKRTGTVSQEAIDVARDRSTTVEDVKKLLFEAENPSEKGVWFPMEGFYVTTEIRDTLNQAFEAAARTDPAIPEAWPAWMKRREVLSRLAMEYISSHPEVATFGDQVNF